MADGRMRRGAVSPMSPTDVQTAGAVRCRRLVTKQWIQRERGVHLRTMHGTGRTGIFQPAGSRSGLWGAEGLPAAQGAGATRPGRDACASDGESVDTPAHLASTPPGHPGKSRQAWGDGQTPPGQQAWPEPTLVDGVKVSVEGVGVIQGHAV